MTTLLEKYIAKVDRKSVAELKEANKIPDYITKGGDSYDVTFKEGYNVAISDIQSLLPELIKEVVEELNWRNWGLGNTPSDSDILDNYEKHLASLAEPNIK
jgi:hypothetical protein